MLVRYCLLDICSSQRRSSGAGIGILYVAPGDDKITPARSRTGASNLGGLLLAQAGIILGVLPV
jgi:hypothetical protein